jgi:hypothetical protein
MKTRTQIYKKIKSCSYCHKFGHDVRSCHILALMVERLHNNCLTKTLQGRPISFDIISLSFLKHLYRRLYPIRRIYMCSRKWVVKSLLSHYRNYLRIKHPSITYHYDKRQKRNNCPVCLSSKICLETNCNHPICSQCYYSYLEKTDRDHLSCPLCRTKIKEMKVCKRCEYQSFVD